MKRVGHLFDGAFTVDAMYAAFVRASRAKRNKVACIRFTARLGAEIETLRDEIFSGTYQPRPYREFMVMEPKPRRILAPDFRDVVVQHAIHAVVGPVFERTFIAQSYACRIGGGTHRASDYLLRALRACDQNSCVLKLDVRKFFYSIDRSVLRQMLERRIKDGRMLGMMGLFVGPVGDVGIPIGNLLSQMYALIYLNDVDHFIKRTLKTKYYVRYVDDMVLVGMNRGRAIELKEQIEAFLADRLRLELSKWSICTVSRGANFVGYRTWVWGRLIRKYSLHKFSRAVAAGKDHTIWSLIAHAKNTASLRHMGNVLSRSPNVFDRIPQSHKRRLATA